MKQLRALCVVSVLLLLVTGCVATTPGVRISTGSQEVKKNQGHGPPPHAPAHGYRAKHNGHDMKFDTGLGVYVVVDIPETYFANNLYIRMGSDGRWMVSNELDRGWRTAINHEVPYKLKEKHPKKGQSKDKKKGKHKKY